MMGIAADAHKRGALRNLEYGASLARRGWGEAGHIVNTLNAEQFGKWLATDKAARSIESVVHA